MRRLEAAPGGTPGARKTVTVVFADIVESTSLVERLEPETAQRVLDRFFDSMRDVVERHGGRVEKFIGDAVMAVFGVPVLHEDDARRAVRAAVGMREALARLNDELDGDSPMPQSRCGSVWQRERSLPVTRRAGRRS